MRNNIAKPFLWYSINISKIIYWTCLLTLLLLFIERIFLIFSYEGHLAGIDNNFDYPIIRSLAGFSMYPNPNSYPFAVNPYAPLYFIVSKAIASTLNIAAANTIAIYRISRSVAFIADTGTVIIFFSLLKRTGKCTHTTAIIIAAFFYTILCYLGYTFNRADCLFLFFYSCTFFLLLTQSIINKTLKSFLIALFVMLTIFSKQNGISLLLLVPLWFILNKDFRQLFILAFFIAILFFSSLYYFQNIFTTHTFISHIFHALQNRIDPQWFYVFIFKLLAESPLIIPLAIAIIISIKLFTENRNSFLAKLGALFIVQFVFSIGLCFKWGSSLGYFNESFFIGLILIASYYKLYQTAENTNFISKLNVYIYPALFIFIFHVTTQFYFYFLNDQLKLKIQYNEQQAVSDYLKKELANKNNYVLNLTSPNSDFFKNILYKESAAPDFDAVNCCTLPDKTFDYTELLNGLQNGKILFLIEKKEMTEKNLWGVELNKYKIDTTLFNYSIYKFDAENSKK